MPKSKLLLICMAGLLFTQSFVLLREAGDKSTGSGLIQFRRPDLRPIHHSGPEEEHTKGIPEPTAVSLSATKKGTKTLLGSAKSSQLGGHVKGVIEEWPPIQSAEIRPGVGIHTVGHGSCTTNFIFKGIGARAGKLYIGTAAHCVDYDVGADVRLGNSRGPLIGKVAYSAWRELQVQSVPCFVLFSCYSDDPNAGNDFALIELNESFRSKVHPAVLTFGGPTGLASYSRVAEGDRIFTFGSTSLRPGPKEIDAREGYIIGKQEPWRYSSYIITPGLPGDSGSNVLLGNGKALGILVTLNGTPPAANGITALDRALQFANERGWQVELQTWPLLYGGLFPALR